MGDIDHKYLVPQFLAVGLEVYTYEYIEKLRRKNNPKNIIAQKGSQEQFLAHDADIVIFGGKRGGSKTFSLLMEALSDVGNPHFYSALLRKEKEDSRKTGGMIDKSNQLFEDFGIYKMSQQDMTWCFHNGAKLKFDYYSDSYEDFKKRFQGLELSYIGVDEITHMEYKYFKYLLTDNRNAHNIKNRFRGTCNPDPDSWVAPFIDWWIGEDGTPIQERNGVIRYCFMYGDNVNEIYWGDTKKEVYMQAKERIDKLWKPEYDKFGNKEDMFIKSVAFLEGRLEENLKLLHSDPNYLANLANQSEDQVARDLGGNWKFKTAGEELITYDVMDKFFTNVQQSDGLHCVTCDPAYDGGDKCVMWYFEGFHVKDVRVASVNSKDTVNIVKDFLDVHGVLEENFCYDLNGLGQNFKGYFPNAKAFNNEGVPTNGDKTIYANLKSECAYKFVSRLRGGGYSIEKDLLGRRFNGKGYSLMSLKDVLLKERRAIARDDRNTDKNWKLIAKLDMKKLIGHSPDFMEGLLFREYLSITQQPKRRIGLGYL